MFLDLQYCNAATVNSDDWNHYIEFQCKRWWGSLLFGLNPRPVFGAPESKLHKIPAHAKIWAISDSQGTTVVSPISHTPWEKPKVWVIGVYGLLGGAKIWSHRGSHSHERVIVGRVFCNIVSTDSARNMMLFYFPSCPLSQGCAPGA